MFNPCFIGKCQRCSIQVTGETMNTKIGCCHVFCVSCCKGKKCPLCFRTSYFCLPLKCLTFTIHKKDEVPLLETQVDDLLV